MPKKIQPENPFEIPVPGKNPEIKPGIDPEYPEFPEKEPDFIPDDDPGKYLLLMKFRPQGKGPEKNTFGENK